MTNQVALIRKLNQEEHELYVGAIIKAIEYVKAFRDGLSLLRPFYDYTAETAYTDPYSRVGLSPWFFEELNTGQRAAVLIHEVMHVLNNHFIRNEGIGANAKIANIAGDFEINCGIDKLNEIDTKYFIFPDKAPFSYPRYLSMEQYYHLVANDDNFKKDEHEKGEGGDSGEAGPTEDGDSGNSSSGSNNQSDESQNQSESNSSSQKSGNKSGKNTQGSQSSSHKNERKGCDESTDERSAAADEAGVDRASEIEQSIAKKNTAVRIVQEKNEAKAIGNSHMHDFLEIAERQMSPPKVSWQSIFRRVFSKMSDGVVKGRSDYSYRRVNRRSHNSEFVFPGMVQYIPKSMVAIDTSRSMSGDDYETTMNEVEGIIRANSKGKDKVQVFSIDTKVDKVKPVNSVKDLDLKGGGGTDMSVGVRYINELNNKKTPDIFVLCTDGYTDWNSYESEVRKGLKKYRHILLITSRGGYKTVPESLKKLITVIDVSLDK